MTKATPRGGGQSKKWHYSIADKILDFTNMCRTGELLFEHKGLTDKHGNPKLIVQFPNLAALCSYIDIPMTTMKRWRNDPDKKYDSLRDALDYMGAVDLNMNITMAQSGNVSSAIAKHIMSGIYGISEKTKTESHVKVQQETIQLGSDFYKTLEEPERPNLEA